ncbi:MAG: amino acid adenylation domain-containing protein [Chloroflexota bacterium]
MTANVNWQQFLDDLSKDGAYLNIHADKLLYDGPPEQLTPQRLQVLRSHKEELIDFIKHDVVHHPLSYGQQALWFEYQLSPEDDSYNVSFALRIQSPLNLEALEQACKDLVNRHPALRTTFANHADEPIQCVHRYQEVKINQIDATTWDEATLYQQVMAVHKCPFALSQGGPWRINLWRLPNQEAVFVWNLHHLICDGWSLHMMEQELRILYDAALSGEASPLPSLKTTYADYTIWQQKMLEQDDDRLWHYWRKQLSGELPVLNLPTDRPRPLSGTLQGASVPIKFSKEQINHLLYLAKEQGVTLYMLLLATFQLLLHRYTGQDELLVGSLMAGRSRPEFTQVFGYFTSPVVIRADLAGNPTFIDFLQQVRQTTLGALQHQDYPFQQIVKRLQPERTPNTPAIFQVAFALQRSQTSYQETKQIPPSAVQKRPTDPTTALAYTGYPIPQNEAQFDLFLEMFTHKDDLIGMFRYCTDLFDEATIQRMVGHFHILLTSILENPDQCTGQMPLLTEAEYHQIVHEWNDTDVDFGEPQTIHALFEQQVERTPDSIAVVFEEQQITYRALNDRANQLAHCLIQRGIGSDALVGIAIERSVEMMIGVLGILKAGGAYVPFDPTYPHERLQFMLEDANVMLIVTTESVKKRFPDHRAETVVLYCGCDENRSVPLNKTNHKNSGFHAELSIEDNGCVEPNPLQLHNSVSETSSNNLAYVLYTSGSTGKPKAVAQTHQTLYNLVSWQQVESHAPERTLQFAPINFDVSAQEFFTTLCVGGTLVMVGPEMRRDPFALLAYIQEQAITRLFIPFTPLQQLAKVADGVMPDTLREVFQAGEALYITKEITNWFHNSECILFNHYGPTESHVVASYRLSQNPELWPSYPSIGSAVANTDLYILDSNQNVLSVGIPGELYIGGTQLAQGYLNRPELTAERFINHPELGRLYKTGDLCRWLPNRNIEFLGRTDFQVKLRGFRIELGEIENALLAQEGVREAAVLVREEDNDQRLVAYIVDSGKLKVESEDADTSTRGNPLDALNSSILRASLVQQLPDYMIPSAFVFLDEMPVTPNGKLDRRALPRPNRIISTTPYTPPATQTEEVISTVWKQALNVEQVGIHDNFFDVGGHSLLTVQVYSQLSKIIPALKMVDLFSYPTIHGLAMYLDQKDINNHDDQGSHEHTAGSSRGRGSQRRARQAKQHQNKQRKSKPRKLVR